MRLRALHDVVLFVSREGGWSGGGRGGRSATVLTFFPFVFCFPFLVRACRCLRLSQCWRSPRHSPINMAGEPSFFEPAVEDWLSAGWPCLPIFLVPWFFVGLERRLLWQVFSKICGSTAHRGHGCTYILRKSCGGRRWYRPPMSVVPPILCSSGLRLHIGRCAHACCNPAILRPLPPSVRRSSRLSLSSRKFSRNVDEMPSNVRQLRLFRSLWDGSEKWVDLVLIHQLEISVFRRPGYWIRYVPPDNLGYSLWDPFFDSNCCNAEDVLTIFFVLRIHICVNLWFDGAVFNAGLFGICSRRYEHVSFLMWTIDF